MNETCTCGYCPDIAYGCCEPCDDPLCVNNPAACLDDHPLSPAPPSEGSSTDGMTTVRSGAGMIVEAGVVVFRDSSRARLDSNQAAPYAQSFPAWRTGQTGGR